MADYDVFSTNFHLDGPASVFVITGGKQGYTQTTGFNPWEMKIYYDGQVVNNTGGSGAITDAVSLFGTINNASPGWHNLRIWWSGSQNIALYGTTLSIQASYK